MSRVSLVLRDLSIPLLLQIPDRLDLDLGPLRKALKPQWDS